LALSEKIVERLNFGFLKFLTSHLLESLGNLLGTLLALSSFFYLFLKAMSELTAKEPTPVKKALKAGEPERPGSEEIILKSLSKAAKRLFFSSALAFLSPVLPGKGSFSRFFSPSGS
jgi:hypothetical protein